MKLSTRAVLLSLFMFPGAGHILLKKKISGCLFIGVGVVATFIIVTSKMQRAYVIADQLSKGEIPFDMQHIIEMVMKILTTAPPGSEGWTIRHIFDFWQTNTTTQFVELSGFD